MGYIIDEKKNGTGVESKVCTEATGLTAKSTPVVADIIVIADTEANDVPKKLTLADLKSIIIPLCKYDATVAPTVNEDSTDGYSIGSTWIDVNNVKLYICMDATEGAAVWKEIAFV